MFPAAVAPHPCALTDSKINAGPLKLTNGIFSQTKAKSQGGPFLDFVQVMAMGDMPRADLGAVLFGIGQGLVPNRKAACYYCKMGGACGMPLTKK
jgi:hypothetical protein